MSQITLEAFAEGRDATRELDDELKSRLASYIDAAKERFRPAAILGFHVGSKDAPKSADAAFAQFSALYKEVAGSLNLDTILQDPMEINYATPAIFPLLYPHSLPTKMGPKRLVVTARFRYVLAFPAFPFQETFALANARTIEDKRRLREVVLHYTILNFTVMQNKNLLRLFEGLRFPIRTERLDGCGALPITTITAPGKALLAPDKVIEQVIKFSGSDAVEEVADVEGWSQLQDPYAVWFEEKWAKLTGPAADSTEAGS